MVLVTKHAFHASKTDTNKIVLMVLIKDILK